MDHSGVPLIVEYFLLIVVYLFYKMIINRKQVIHSIVVDFKAKS